MMYILLGKLCYYQNMTYRLFVLKPAEDVQPAGKLIAPEHDIPVVELKPVFDIQPAG